MAEIETRFEHVAKSIAQDPEIRNAMAKGLSHVAADQIMDHLGQMTLADLVRQAIRDGCMSEVQILVDEIQDE